LESAVGTEAVESVVAIGVLGIGRMYWK